MFVKYATDVILVLVKTIFLLMYKKGKALDFGENNNEAKYGIN